MAKFESQVLCLSSGFASIVLNFFRSVPMVPFMPYRQGPVWPDVEIKATQIYPKAAQKVAKAVNT